MTENLNSSIETSLSQSNKKPWDYLTKKQKVALGVLSFIVLVLPLSLLLIRTKTNLFPKASFPTTPPITPPVSPTPSSSPLPLSSWCEPCNPSLPPSTPNSRCQEGLVCHYEEPECFETEGGGTVCSQQAGASGLCVNPEESIAVCQTKPTPTPTPPPGCFYEEIYCIQAPCNPILICPSPSPSSSPWPSPSVSPTPIPSPGMAISLASEDLPTDPRITWQGIPTNELLLSQTASISTKTTLIGSQNLAVESGYGQFFTFYIEPGTEFEILAKELDISSVGSYIETTFYGPDKKKIIDAGTRIQHTATENGPYYLVVYTFDNKQGVAEITVSNKFRIYLYPYVKRIDQDMEQLQSWHRMGRKAADFFLQAPRIDNINNEYITYISQTDNSLQTEVPRVKVTQTCPLTQQATDLPINIQKFNNPNSVPLREIQMKIYPQSSAYYPPGYDYTVNLEYPDPNRGWGTGFSTTSKSGVGADLNDDGAVDISDYSLLVSEFMQSNNFLVSDLNCDGLVDISDYSLLIGNISL